MFFIVIKYITGSFETKDLLNANPKSNIIPKGKYLVLGDNREGQNLNDTLPTI
jgi:hypothetical protein